MKRTASVGTFGAQTMNPLYTERQTLATEIDATPLKQDDSPSQKNSEMVVQERSNSLKSPVSSVKQTLMVS